MSDEDPTFAWVEIDGVTPVEIRNPGSSRWFPARLAHWRRRDDRWEGFAWPEELSGPAHYGRHDHPPDAPQGWLDLDDIRPAGHDVSSAIPNPGGRDPRAVEPWFWPPE